MATGINPQSHNIFLQQAMYIRTPSIKKRVVRKPCLMKHSPPFNEFTIRNFQFTMESGMVSKTRTPPDLDEYFHSVPVSHAVQK